VVERSIYRHANPATAVADIVLDPFISPWRSANTTPASVMASGPAIPQVSLDCDLKAELAKLEQQLIRRTLEQYHFHQRRSAQALGLSYDQLRAALRKYPHLLAERNQSEG
jgi:psp operon transcriptional activator